MTDSLDQLEVLLGGRYRIERELGRGGMATVYLAHDEKHARPVAIKVLEVAFASPGTSGRFEREIEIAASLTHPHILSLHDSGQVDGLFYYVMPYVEGESLADRLSREKQLPVGDAIRITREVADALAYAHSHGVVHRDIKPSNILLASGSAIVVDFGIAKALTEAGDDRITRTGQRIGTAGYMSPEQAAGEADVDGRSDQYSLACVLYEMLVGEPPYTGRSAQAVIAKQMTVRPAPVGAVRDTVQPAIDRVLQRALSRIPADRYPRIEEFSAALEAAELNESGTFPAAPRPRPPRAMWYATAAALTVVGVIWATLSVERGEGDVTGSPPDTSRYAIFPFDHAPGVGDDLLEVQHVRDALARWDGADVVDVLELRESLAGEADPTAESAARLAVTHGAGRYIWGDITPIGDSIRVVAGLYDSTRRIRLADESVRIDSSLADADSVFADLVDRLLLRESVSSPSLAATSTRSLAARQALEAGHRAVLAWELDRADASYSDAADHDSEFAAAHVWLALARMWKGADELDWRLPVDQAALRPELLSERDELFMRATAAQAHGEYELACRLWANATSDYERDFTAWYGLAHCLTEDGVVLPDAASPSRWSFRTSYHRALAAYQRAFTLRPQILLAFAQGSYQPLRETFMISGNKRRTGFAALPDSMGFDADPAWQGDSLALIPYPHSERHASRLTASPAEVGEAVRRLRIMFHEVTRGWAVTEPEDPKALEALAIAMQLLGDPAALDTLQRARELAEYPSERLRIAGDEVWMRLAFSLPGDERGLRMARDLADSLLLVDEPSIDPALAAGLAALAGRASQAASLAREPSAAEDLDVTPAVRMTAAALLMFASLGGPLDSIADLERFVAEALEQTTPPQQLWYRRLTLIGRPATLAFPAYVSPRMDVLTSDDLPMRDWLLDAQAALLDGDTTAVSSGLEDLRQARQGLDATFDSLYPEAELYAALGDWEGAVGWIDPSLKSLSRASPAVMGSPERVAPLIRTAALRARAANKLGDRTEARRWAAAVVLLWSDADPCLQPVVSEMRALANE